MKNNGNRIIFLNLFVPLIADRYAKLHSYIQNIRIIIIIIILSSSTSARIISVREIFFIIIIIVIVVVIIIIIIIIIIIKIVSSARSGKSENTNTISESENTITNTIKHYQRSHPTNPWKEEKEKITETKKEIRPTGKHFLCS